jgi:hypothetical protein
MSVPARCDAVPVECSDIGIFPMEGQIPSSGGGENAAGRACRPAVPCCRGANHRWPSPNLLAAPATSPRGSGLAEIL